MIRKLILLVAALVVGEAMGEFEYFNTASNRQITWAHAVNNQINLNASLADTKLHMIEADVIIGKYNGSKPEFNVAIMGHPPATESNLTLSMFLTYTINHNKDKPNNQKGIKLDFKTDAALKQAYVSLDKMKNATFPIWINADIFTSTNATIPPISKVEILAAAARYPNATLSIGWTTIENTGNYTTKQVTEMLDFIKKNNIKNVITFPVRARLAAECREQMKMLASNNTKNTLTLWQTNTDLINIANLRTLIKDLGDNKVYVDLNSTVIKSLNSATSMALSVGVVLASFAAMFLGNFC